MSIHVTAATVAIGTQQSLSIAQGEDREFRLTFTESGTARDMTGVTACILTVRSRTNGLEILSRSYSGFQGLATAGTPRFQILAADTASQAAAVYDCWVEWTDASGYVEQLLVESSFEILTGADATTVTTPPAVPVVYGINWSWASGLSPFWTGKSGGYNTNDGVQAHDGSLGATAISTFRAVSQGVTAYPVTGSSAVVSSGWAYIGQHGGAGADGSAGGGGTPTTLAGIYSVGGGNGGTGNMLGVGGSGMSEPIKLRVASTTTAVRLVDASTPTSQLASLGRDADGSGVIGGGSDAATILKSVTDSGGDGIPVLVKGADGLATGDIGADVYMRAGNASGLGVPGSIEITSGDRGSVPGTVTVRAGTTAGVGGAVTLSNNGSSLESPDQATIVRSYNANVQINVDGTDRALFDATKGAIYSPNNASYVDVRNASVRMNADGSAGAWYEVSGGGIKWVPDSNLPTEIRSADETSRVRVENAYAQIVGASSYLQVATGAISAVFNNNTRFEATATGFRAYAPNGADFLGVASGAAQASVPFQAPVGSATLPAYGFGGYSGAGMYWDEPNNRLAFSYRGAEQLRLNGSYVISVVDLYSLAGVYSNNGGFDTGGADASLGGANAPAASVGKNNGDRLRVASGIVGVVLGGATGNWQSDGATGFKFKPVAEVYAGFESADANARIRVKSSSAEVLVQAGQDGLNVGNGETYLLNGSQIGVSVLSGSTKLKAAGGGVSIEVVNAARTGSTGALGFYGSVPVVRPSVPTTTSATMLHAALVALGLITL